MKTILRVEIAERVAKTAQEQVINAQMTAKQLYAMLDDIDDELFFNYLVHRIRRYKPDDKCVRLGSMGRQAEIVKD